MFLGTGLCLYHVLPDKCFGNAFEFLISFSYVYNIQLQDGEMYPPPAKWAQDQHCCWIGESDYHWALQKLDGFDSVVCTWGLNQGPYTWWASDLPLRYTPSFCISNVRFEKKVRTCTLLQKGMGVIAFITIYYYYYHYDYFISVQWALALKPPEPKLGRHILKTIHHKTLAFRKLFLLSKKMRHEKEIFLKMAHPFHRLKYDIWKCSQILQRKPRVDKSWKLGNLFPHLALNQLETRCLQTLFSFS